MILVTDPNTLHVMQGKLRLAHKPDDVLVSILGSCVAACVRDPILRIGGMNHFLLPGSDPRDSGNVRYGARSMEELINALLRAGADKRRLEVWLFGGADVLGGKTNIGSANASFAMDFVRAEGFRLRGHDLGGKQGRRLRFHPHSGEFDISLMQKAPVEKAPPAVAPTAEIELF
jgi:chemotaxis protein CheD